MEKHEYMLIIHTLDTLGEVIDVGECKVELSETEFSDLNNGSLLFTNFDTKVALQKGGDNSDYIKVISKIDGTNLHLTYRSKTSKQTLKLLLTNNF